MAWCLLKHRDNFTFTFTIIIINIVIIIIVRFTKISPGLFRFRINFWNYESFGTFWEDSLDRGSARPLPADNSTTQRNAFIIRALGGIRSQDTNLRAVQNQRALAHAATAAGIIVVSTTNLQRNCVTNLCKTSTDSSYFVQKNSLSSLPLFMILYHRHLYKMSLLYINIKNDVSSFQAVHWIVQRLLSKLVSDFLLLYFCQIIYFSVCMTVLKICLK